MEVSHLQPEVICRLRSGICITSCSHAVEELVINAIDAGATCIAVRLNLPFFKIQVVDNGEGIPADDLKYIGERYMTSKCHTLEDLEHLKSGGFRGEAVSSLKDVSSVLEIVSRHCRSEKTFCKIFKHGLPLSPSLSKEPRPSRGTTITILDFLYNMPVRKKCISEALDLELCRKCIENIALMHPSVSFSLRSDATGEICLQTRKCGSSLSVFTQLFGHEKATNLKEVAKEHGKYRVEGYISTEGHVSKDLQFIYVNKRYVSKTKILKWINKVLSKALFTRQKMYYKDMTPNTLANSPSKSQIRHSIFILNITCPFCEYDIIFEPRKTMIEFEDWSTVMELVQSAVLNFLTLQNLICGPEGSDEAFLNTPKSEISREYFAKLPENYGKDISIENAKNALFSAAAKRVSHLNEECRLNGVEWAVDSFGGNECTRGRDTLANALAESACSSETFKRGLSSGGSFSNSEFGANSESLIPPVVHNRIARNSNAEKKLFPQDELSGGRNVLCSENIDLNSPSLLAAEDTEVKNFPGRNNSGSSCFSESSSLVEDPLYSENKNQSFGQSSAALNNGKLWSVKNPVLLKIPVESSISFLKKQTGQKDTFSSDEFSSPGDIELPDLSAIPSKNPILLRVPMKSSLSALEKHAKRTQKFTELKNKYGFSTSKKQIKSCRNVPKNEHSGKKTRKHDNKGNIFKLKNASLDERGSLAVERQQKTLFPQSECTQNSIKNVLHELQKDSPDVAMAEHTQRKSDHLEIGNNDMLFCNSLTLASMQDNSVPNSNLGAVSSVPEDDRRFSVLKTPQDLGSDGMKLANENRLTSHFFPHEKKSVIDLEAAPFNGVWNNGSNIVEHFHMRPRTLNNKFGLSPEKVKIDHVVNSHRKSKTLDRKDAEKMAKTCSELKVTDGQNSKDDIQVQWSSFKGLSSILSSEESDVDLTSGQEFRHHTIFLKTYNDDLHTTDSNFVAKPKDESYSKMEIATDRQTLPETQPFSVAEEMRSLGFEPEIDEMDSDNKAKEAGETDIGNFHDQKATDDVRSCLLVDNITSENRSNQDGSVSEELRASSALQDNDVKVVTEETKCTQNEPFVTNIQESSNIKINESHVERKVEFRNSCDDCNAFCGTSLKINASDVLFVENSESQEVKVCNSGNTEPNYVPDFLEGEKKMTKGTHERCSDSLCSQNVPKIGELFGTTVNSVEREENCADQDKHNLCLFGELKFRSGAITPKNYESRTVSDHAYNSSKLGSAILQDLSNEIDANVQNLMGFSNHPLPESTDEGQKLQPENSNCLHNLNENESLQSVVVSKSANVGNQVDIKAGEIFTNVSFEDFEDSNIDRTQPMLHLVDTEQTKQLPSDGNSEDLFSSKSNSIEGFSSVNVASCHGTLHRNMNDVSQCTKSAFDGNQSRAEIVLQETTEHNSGFIPHVINEVSILEAVTPSSSINCFQFPGKGGKDMHSFSFESIKKPNQQLSDVKVLDHSNSFSVSATSKKTLECDVSFTEICIANQESLSAYNSNISEHTTKEDDIILAGESETTGSTSHLDGNSDQISGKRLQCSVMISETNEIPPRHSPDKTFQSGRELCNSATDDDGKPMWFPQQDPVTNEVIYLHAATGNSSYKEPVDSSKVHAENERYNRKHISGQKLHSHFFLSHNSTPFLPRPAKLRKKGKGDASPGGGSDFNGDRAELKDSLTNYLEEQEINDLARKWNQGQMNAVDTHIGEMFNSWENPMFLRCASEIDLPANVIGHLQPTHLKMYSIINSYRFTKTAFSHLQVIGQVDCKFIACIVQDVNENIKGKNLLVLFDQHAVHERIRLEQLIDDLFEVNRQGQKAIKTAELSTPVVIHLKPEEIRLLKAYPNRLTLFGLRLSLQKDSQDVDVHAVPTCLIERENSDLKRKRQPVTATVVENLIREWIISLEQTRSTSSVLPKTLIGILNSQACRGAVKFGDPLDVNQCRQLMQSLSLCKLPFQCAHGRPSLAPLLDLDKITNLDEKKPKPVLSKIIKMKDISCS